MGGGREEGHTDSAVLFSNGLNDWDDSDNGISVSDDATAVHRIWLHFSRTDGEKLRILRCTISDIPTVAKRLIWRTIPKGSF